MKLIYRSQIKFGLKKRFSLNLCVRQMGFFDKTCSEKTRVFIVITFMIDKNKDNYNNIKKIILMGEKKWGLAHKKNFGWWTK